MKKRNIFLSLLLIPLLIGCKGKEITGDDQPLGPIDFEPKVTFKEIDKEEYLNKTLAGLLGQFAGFLSGYEFVSSTNPVGLPLEWFDFINGPYAGNWEYYTPVDTYKYNRLVDGKVWSDDDYHIDILNQYVLKEKGFSSYAIKETWKKYQVSDWGGGGDAMMLMNSRDLLPPYTGTIESGNRYGWCTEAYIEVETLGMNAPGMPNLATELVDRFGSNVGYFDSLILGKFYAAMYSLAYFSDDAIEVMKEASEVFPKNSYPYKTYHYALDAFEEYPNNYKAAAQKVFDTRRNLYRIDNVQTDPNVNGGLAILSFLYGNNDYMETAKYSSMMGCDGDCTAAICCGLMGIIKGFKPGNEEYAKINELIYKNGEGIYHNDVTTTFQARILSDIYPEDQKIDDIILMYRDNFETFLIQKGGEILDNTYKIPTTELIKSRSILFENYDAEERNTTGFRHANGDFSAEISTETGDAHTGFGYFKLINNSKAEAYHRYSLTKGHKYRLSTYVKTTDNTQVDIFARDPVSQEIKETISFANVPSLINKIFTFTATNSVMEVGFKFADSSLANTVLIFDDFMLEEIYEKPVKQVSEDQLNLYNKRYLKMIDKPSEVLVGKEVIIRVNYRQYSGATMFVNVIRNNQQFGSVLFSNTSRTSLNGSAFADIPYIFEQEIDYIQLDFGDSKVYIGSIEILQPTQYMFR